MPVLYEYGCQCLACAECACTLSWLSSEESIMDPWGGGCWQLHDSLVNTVLCDGQSGELCQLPREVLLVHGENDGFQSIAQGWQQRCDGCPHQLDHFLQAAKKETFNYSRIPLERPPWWDHPSFRTTFFPLILFPSCFHITQPLTIRISPVSGPLFEQIRYSWIKQFIVYFHNNTLKTE